MILVKHLRFVDRVPFATIVAIDAEHIGVAFCNEKDQFKKSLGIQIARGRAELGSECKIPRGSCYYHNQELSFQEIIDMEVERMKQRAQRYFLSGVLC